MQMETRVHFRCDDETLEALAAASKELKLSKSLLIRSFIRQGLGIAKNVTVNGDNFNNFDQEAAA